MKRKLLLILTLVFFCLSALSVSAKDGTNSVSALTPDGNLTLVDDIQTENKQFLTVQTKNGNYFYIVIDRSDDSENVYFLNTVDEADLRTLLGDEADSVLSSYTGNTQDSETKLPQDTTAEKQKILIRGIVLLVVFGGIGGAAYFLMKKKNPKKESAFREDFDRDRDDETLDAPMAQESDKKEAPEPASEPAQNTEENEHDEKDNAQ